MDSFREGRREREKGGWREVRGLEVMIVAWRNQNCYYMTNWREGGRKRERGVRSYNSGNWRIFFVCMGLL